jgi:hypothetical protein
MSPVDGWTATWPMGHGEEPDTAIKGATINGESLFI